MTWGGSPKINWRLARQMWRNGKDTAHIAAELGVSEGRIYNGLSKGRGLTYEADQRKAPAKNFNVVRTV